MNEGRIIHNSGVRSSSAPDQGLGSEFLSHGDTQAKEELLAGHLGEALKSIEGFAAAAKTGNLEVLVEENTPGGISGKPREGGAEQVFQGRKNRAGGGLFSKLNEFVGDAGGSAARASGGQAPRFRVFRTDRKRRG